MSVLVRDGEPHPRERHHHIGTETCCRSCGRVWSSRRQGHCTECHRQFGGVTGFDMHRERNECLSDRSLGRRGLSRIEDKHGVVWSRSFPANLHN